MRLTLVGTGITLPQVDESALRYNLATARLEASVRTHPERSSWEVTRIDLPFALSDIAFTQPDVDRVIASQPDVLGLSCYSWDVEAQLSLAATVRAELPYCRIVLGGPSASFLARDLLAKHQAIDAVVRGEGETTLAELLGTSWRDLEGLAGLTWRRPDGAIVDEADRPPSDLETLPSPYLSGVLRPPRQNLLFEFSRGCIYRCAYCAWKTQGHGVRYVSASRIRDEVAWAKARGYEHAFIIDSAINHHDERLAVLADAIQQADPAGDLAFSYFVDYPSVSRHQVNYLSRFRPHEITIGLESVNPMALRACGRKPVDLARFEQALDLLAEVGPPTPSIMLGMPGDDLSGFKSTLDFLARQAERGGPNRVRSVRVHWMLIAPGSRLWSRAAADETEIPSRGIPYVLGSKTFPRADLIEALHVLRSHPRADLFVWEDAEPLRLLGAKVPQMVLPGGDHLGGRAPRHIEDAEALGAIRPLVPGRELPEGWRVGDVERRYGWPVVVLLHQDGSAIRLQIRARDSEPHPFKRTNSYDLVLLSDSGGPRLGRHEQKLLRALVKLIVENDTSDSDASAESSAVPGG